MRTGRNIFRASPLSCWRWPRPCWPPRRKRLRPRACAKPCRRVHAIVGAKIVISPEKTIENGTLVVRRRRDRGRRR